MPGSQVILRPVEECDLELMMKWRNSARDYFLDDSLMTIENQESWFRNYLQNSTDKFFIIQTPDGRCVGTVCLYHLDFENRSAEIGRLIIGEKAFLGKGYAFDACRTLISYSFDELNLNRIYLYVFETNQRAISLYEGLGFVREGVLREAVLRNGKRLNILIMSVLRREFRRG